MKQRMLIVIFVCQIFVFTAHAGIKMPMMKDEQWVCSQGNNAPQCCDYDHWSSLGMAYAWDFSMTGSADNDRPIVAPMDGRVVDCYYQCGTCDDWGNFVVLELSNGTFARMCHFQQVFVRKGENIKQGQVVGTCGTTGNSTGYHVHFQIQSSLNGSSIQTSFDDVGVPVEDSQYTSQNHNIFDLEKALQGAPIGNENDGVVWYPDDWNANDRYDGNNCARRCYKQAYSGGTFGNCAIVYDALGGASKAYTVRTGFWNNGQGNGWSQLHQDGHPTEIGPQGPLGMPVTNEYANGTSCARQDFQEGYLYYNGSIVSVNVYPHCAPGWTSSGWNSQYSYLFALAYERNNARNDVGEASGNVQTLSGNILYQQFSMGNDGSGMIIYDMENWECNDEATNEAYWVYGGIKTRYDKSGVSIFGCATIDRFQDGQGRWCQDFKNSAGTRYRIFENGTITELGYCSDGEFHIAGGSSGTSFPSNYTLIPLSGDWDNDDAVEAGCYCRNDTKWYRDNNLDGVAESGVIFGSSTDTAMTADVDGNEEWDFIIYRPSNQYFYIDTNHDGTADISVLFGASGDIPLIGDWDGNGTYTFGVYRPSNQTFYLDNNLDGQADVTKLFGASGDMPLTGDFDGNGSTTFGVYRPSNQYFYLDNNLDGQADVSVLFGASGDTPLIGDWDGNGSQTIGVYRTSNHYYYLDNQNDGQADHTLAFGTTGDIPILGDWDGNSSTNVGVYRPGNYYIYLDLDFSGGDADLYFELRQPGGYPKIAVPENPETVNLPATFSLFQNYPNPFNPVTTISYVLPTATRVTLSIYNILGQRVATLVNERQEAGVYQTQFDCSECSSGIYFYRIATDQISVTKKMLLLK